MARLMEIFEVKCIVPDLIARRGSELGFTDFELDDKDEVPDGDNGIDPLPEPGDRELEIDVPGFIELSQGGLQDFDLGHPRSPLFNIDSKAGI